MGGFEAEDEFGEDKLGCCQREDEAGGAEEDELFQEAEGGVLGSESVLAVEQIEEPVEERHPLYYN